MSDNMFGISKHKKRDTYKLRENNHDPCSNLFDKGEPEYTGAQMVYLYIKLNKKNDKK
jgi:hypothetical protein